MKKLMLGNEAVARGAYEAGVSVVSSYPGTPSTEITEKIAEYDEIYSEWAPNEKVALEVAIGASFAGARAMSCMKHVGLNVAADPLYTASYTGVGGGLVICVADDQGMHSSQNEQDSRLIAISSKVPMLEPSDSEECKRYVKKEYELSEKYDTPVLIRLSTRVSHSQSLVSEQPREEYCPKEYVKDTAKRVMMPAMAMKRHHYVEKRMNDLRELAEDCEYNTVEINSNKIGVISAGIAYQYAKEAFGGEASFLKLGMINPLPSKLIKDFAEKMEKVYVIEELEPVIENHCRMLGINVIGKDILPNIGEFSVGQIKKAVFGESAQTYAPQEEIPVRPPVMCPGCPHRGTFYVMKKLGLIVSGDIGCYTLGALAPLGSMDMCVCMGASIGMAHGIEKARGREMAQKTVAVIGDSTFIHSGITGLVDIAYNKGTSTVVILDNSITGMTGHQDNPATGFTIKGEPTKAVDLAALCKAVGIERVVVADPFDLENFERILKEETGQTSPPL